MGGDSTAALAHAYGVEPSYVDMEGRRQNASAEALIAILRALGAPVETSGDVPGALRHRRQERWSSLAEPVVVAWNARHPTLDLRLPAGGDRRLVQWELVQGDGRVTEWRQRLGELPLRESTEVEGVRYERRRLSLALPLQVRAGQELPAALPFGYHRLHLEVASAAADVLVIAAPHRAYSASDLAGAWGIFAPLYALHSKSSWGVGDVGDLASLIDWLSGLGGALAATTPLLAAFLDEPCEPSPYSPISRLYWNELYVELARVPELMDAPPPLLRQASVLEELAELRAALWVDYPRAMALKRRLLEAAAKRFFAEAPCEAFEAFRTAQPDLEKYARFRAVGERLRTTWPHWPEPLRSGRIREGDFPLAASRYHQYVQWLADQQIGAVAGRARERGVALLFDLPLGAHPEGYDVWRHQDLFAQGVTVGAPPDPGVPTGQDWRFPPALPERARATGHAYFIESIRHQMAQAGVLRIDHVMSLHHLYWVPKGRGPREGAYVRYPWEELYAILCLESHRHRTMIVGEDLGTVPGQVRSTMRRHGLLRTYVLQLDVLEPAVGSADPVPLEAVASLNTHDLPPFASFWGDETAQAARAELAARLRQRGLLSEEFRMNEELGMAFEASTQLLARSAARVALVNLEDLWQETERQNVPGTEGGANWRRKMRHPLEELGRFEEALRRVLGVRFRARASSSSSRGHS